MFADKIECLSSSTYSRPPRSFHVVGTRKVKKCTKTVGARPFELRSPVRSPSHSIGICFDFPLIRVAVALNTRKTEHCRRKGGKRGASRGTSLSVHWRVLPS